MLPALERDLLALRLVLNVTTDAFRAVSRPGGGL